MVIKKSLLLPIFIAIQSCCQMPFAQQFKQAGYVEMCDYEHGAATFETLYAYFDKLIMFLQANPAWSQKLYSAKERFIRSKERSCYATDFFGFYDESKKERRGQLSFYYSTHFHEFICSCYPEFKTIPEIINFLQACLQIQKSYKGLCSEIAVQLGLQTIFSCIDGCPPVLLKVVKYLPSYVATRPHYDGTAFSLFLDSTDNQSLLLSPYKSRLTVDDFSSPIRKFPRDLHQSSILLTPGALLTEFSIYPTPHIVVPSGETRHATIAFVMRPHHISQTHDFSYLPSFKH